MYLTINVSQAKKLISKGGTIVEGSAGNTGIGLAVVCKEYGLNLKIVIPKTQSTEKDKMKQRNKSDPTYCITFIT